MSHIAIRSAAPADRAAIWTILEPVIRAGETYALDRAMREDDALDIWLATDKRTFVAIDRDGAVLGTYYLRANQPGGGSHVANCGYVVAASAGGRGVARMMAAHSIEQARAAGYRAMQFNFVVSTNARAVSLWRSLGFAIVGTLPGAFAHPALGDVDALVMYRTL